MRYLFAVLCVLLIVWAAVGQQPRYTVKNKVPKYTVANKVPAVIVQPAPAPEVRPVRPFQGYPTTLRTDAPSVAGVSMWSPAGSLAGTSTPARRVIVGGTSAGCVTG